MIIYTLRLLVALFIRPSGLQVLSVMDRIGFQLKDLGFYAKSGVRKANKDFAKVERLLARLGVSS